MSVTRQQRILMENRLTETYSLAVDEADPHGLDGTLRGPFPSRLDDKIAHLLGFKDAIDLMLGWNDQVEAVIRSLKSTHGKTIYKALMIRNQL